MRDTIKIDKLSSFCKVISGQSPKGSAYNENGIGVEFHQGKKAFGPHTIQSSNVWTTEITKLAQPGDILMSVRAPVGPTNFTDREVCIGRGLAAIRCKPEVLPQYILYVLKSIESKIVGKDGAVFNSISKDMIEDLPVPAVDKEEQQRIVDILDREFAKIDALKANAEKSLQAAKDLFRHISNGYYNEPSPVSKLGDECIFVRGPFGGSLKKSCFVSSGYPVYEQQHAIYSTFTFRYFVNEEKYNEMKRFTTHPGDLIMSCSGTIGKVAIIPEDAPIGIINQALLKLTPKKTILPEYFKWYMQSISFEKDIQRHSKGAAIQNVASVAILKEIAIPVPTIEKQKQIVARLDDLNERCNALQENYQKTFALCDDLKQSLLRKAFNGEL